MKGGAAKVLSVLDHKLMKLDRRKHELGIVRDGSSFSRRPRKLSFIDDMRILMSMGPSSIREEMYGYFGLKTDTASAPGFIKSRAKIREEAFRELMAMMDRAYPCERTYRGYRLLAVDGSDIAIPFDGGDGDSLKSNGKCSRPSSLCHLNALYDILNRRYLDASIQGVRSEDERKAMVDMARRYGGGKAIFIADRGYESYNTFESLRNTGSFFLIRIRNVESRHSVCRRFRSLPEKDEFDEEIEVVFTNRQTNSIKEHPEKYIVIMSNQHFSFLDKDRHFHEARYRIARIRTDGRNGEYGTVITNLPKDEFSTQDIRELYRLRWGIEVSYRHLKYSIGLNALHSRRRDFIRQEIWARLAMFNVSMMVIDEAARHKLKKEGRKHEYEINVAHAVHLVKRSMAKRKGGVPPDLIELIAKGVLPVRPGRTSMRKVRAQGCVSFNYRFC